MLGSTLKSLRLNARKTQEDMAKYLGITRGAYSHIENERNEPDMNTIKKLASYFDVSIDYLLGNSDSPKPDSANNESFFEDFKNRKEVIDFVSELTDADKEAIGQLKEIWKVIKKK
ncbi:helix-turn-helix domain-containing protein [Listeria booriae]|uniref:helix-turn-helix domain-containing protein n=1 Tax=Listeria booriae TaxID=1552123 RepID=UPI00162944ED|nr:helix-turn-helix transcriptional regulator [Listeria booriae]MBC1983448.1 helix-turn-helix transcriptional regulator [Listeria booriae]